MKTKILFIVMITITLLASGCVSSIKLTEDESNKIAEYLSYVILSNSSYFDSKLKVDEVTPTAMVVPVSPDDAIPTVTPEVGGGNGGTITPTQAPLSVSFSEIIGIKGLTVDYKDYKIVNEILEKGYSVTAPKGHNILVINFVIKNSTKKEIKMDLVDSKIDYRLQVEGKNPIKPMLAYTKNILQYTEFAIPAKDSMEGVLLFFVDSSMKKVNGSVEIVKGDKLAVIELK